jgi:hypothetical protein
VDLRDPSVGVRRVRALIRGLPTDAAFVRSQLGPTAAWTNDSEMLASLVELTHANLRAKAGKKAGNIPPLRIPRPYDRRAKRKPSTPAELQAFLTKTRSPR